ncbi:hypothetical protein ATCV1_z731R [Acanthocystis turfacea chlorella virus 1]|uniref:Uncharacterized protein z731R n=1 Tax=Chlorovirus heliozoae TaxID=322019 RepID=A7K9Z1_9PHYC|nr:hypothetical protein ATCV1_z731R [Acanthocystis turfacea chlorella virus 1]ABT16865.1 hypothetical protein ATCV1_z731R [Acanthocystis turfacea chlorella virus 1]
MGMLLGVKDNVVEHLVNERALVSRRATFVRRLQETVNNFMTARGSTGPYGLGSMPDPHGVLGVPKRQVNKAKHNIVADFFHNQPIKERKRDVEEVLNDVVALRVPEHVPRKLVKRDDQVCKVRIADEPGVE